MVGWFEQVAPNQRNPLNVRGRLVSRDPDVYETFDVADYGESISEESYLPLPPVLSGSLTAQDTASLTWVPQTQTWPRTAVTEYRVYRTADGGDPELLTTVDETVLAYEDSAAPTGSPEVVLTYQVVAVNVDGERGSNILTLQWTGTPLTQPTSLTNLAVSNVQATSVRLTWNSTPDATVTKIGIFQGLTILVNDIPANATSWDFTGLTTGQTYSNINVRRYNGWPGGSAPGWSPGSNTVSFTPQTSNAPLFLGHVPGKVYLGWSTSHNEGSSASGQNTAESQLNNQTPLPTSTGPQGSDFAGLLGVRRLYSKDNSAISHADAQQRVLWISAKGDDLGAAGGVNGWAQIANGQVDASIESYFTSLVARNKLTIFTFHHEPIGDSNNPVTDGTTHVDAHLRIMQVVDAEFPGHRIIFCPNYEENRLRNLQVNGTFIDWSRWLPEDMLPGKGGPRPWDFISFDMYQYGANTSTNTRAGVQFSHRWWRIDELFTGEFTPNGTTAMSYMDYTPGVDLAFGIGECASRPGAFYNFQQGSGTQSNMTGAKYARDMMDYIFSNPDKYAFVSWFNSIGADLIYNDERLFPGTNTWGGKTPNHPSFVQQTGDTEYTINVYREKIAGGLSVKLAANGLPPT